MNELLQQEDVAVIKELTESQVSVRPDTCVVNGVQEANGQRLQCRAGAAVPLRPGGPVRGRPRLRSQDIVIPCLMATD